MKKEDATMIKSHNFAWVSFLAAILIIAAFIIPVKASDTPDEPALAAQTAQADIFTPQEEPASEDATNPDMPAESGYPESQVKAGASNTPFFIGAIIAVLAFIGVSVFCKVKGNKYD